MTKKVVTVDRLTTYSEIVRLLTEHRISGVPVLTMGRRVAGVVSEADLVAAEDADARQARIAAEARTGRRPQWGRPHRPNLTVGGLMTSPALTINPDATIPRAAREMHTHHVRRLPVVDEDGKLVGIVSRRDLLRVFLRPDAEVADDVRDLLDDLLPSDPASVTATVHNGVVVLTGDPRAPEDRQLIPVAVRLIWDVDGVIDVDNRLGQQAGAGSGESLARPAIDDTQAAGPEANDDSGAAEG